MTEKRRLYVTLAVLVDVSETDEVADNRDVAQQLAAEIAERDDIEWVYVCGVQPQ